MLHWLQIIYDDVQALVWRMHNIIVSVLVYFTNAGGIAQANTQKVSDKRKVDV